MKSSPNDPKSPAEPAPIIVPFTAGIDSREQQPYLFRGLKANADKKYAPLIVPTERMNLPTGFGDYTIAGFRKIGIERKSKEDLYGSIGQRRANFEDRLVRMSGSSCLWYSAIMVEAELSELIADPPHHSQLHPKSLMRTILAWQMRYPRVGWWFAANRSMAEGLTFRLLERFWAMYGHYAAGVNAVESAGTICADPDSLSVALAFPLNDERTVDHATSSGSPTVTVKAATEPMTQASLLAS